MQACLVRHHSAARATTFKIAAATVLAVAGLAFQRDEGAAQTAEPVYSVSYLEVETGAVNKAVDLIKKYREASRREEGNTEYLALQDIHRPNHFAIVEGWSAAAASTKHEQGAAAVEFAKNLNSIRIAPPDKHVVEAFDLAAARPRDGGGQVYMVEHIDFMPPGREVAPSLVKALADGSRKESGTIRYDVFRQLARRNNHYQVVSTWASLADFNAHETGESARRFRSDSSLGKPAERANLYDQRLYKAL